MTNVKYVPQLFWNMISLTSVLSKGYKLTGNEKGISIQKLNRKYLFDQHIKSRDGELVGVEIETLQTDMTAICRGYKHAVLGYPSAETTNMTAKKLSLNIKPHENICENCIMGKQRQKYIPKNTEFKAEKAGKRVYFDISSIQYKSLGGSKFWLLFVDKYTGFKKSYFLSAKSQIAEKGLEYINFLETNNINVKTFRCDNAGENEKFKEKLIELRKMSE